MKKYFLFFFLIVAFSISIQAQPVKKDSVMVVITLDTTTYKQLLFTIDNNVDSKRTTQIILNTITSNAEQKLKKDALVIAIMFDTITYKQLLLAIENNIDSKKVTKAIVETIQSNAQLLFDKPSQIPLIKKKE